MKALATILSIFFVYSGHASTACSDFNTETRIAREAVKGLIALADVPKVIAYYGGVQSNEGGITIVNVQPHFQYTKDWYKVSVRNSDCRVMNAALFLEKLPIE